MTSPAQVRRQTQWTWWILVIALGACAGFAGMRSLETVRSDQAPNGWSRVGPKIPFQQAATVQASATVEGSWNLDHYESLWGQEPVDHLAVTAVVPDGAVQRILLCSLRKEGLEGPGVVIDRSTSPGTVRGVRLTPRAQTNLKCEGDPLPSPTDEPYTVELERHTQTGRYFIRVGDAVTECRGAVPKDGPAIVGGLARTSVLAVATDGRHQAPLFHRAFVPLGLMLAGFAWAGLCWTERRRGESAIATVVSSLPLLLCLPLALPEPDRVAESLQLKSLATPWLAFMAGVGPALLWKALTHIGRTAGVTRGEQPLPRRFEPWAVALAPILPAAIGLAMIPGEQSRPTVLGTSLLVGSLAAMALVALLQKVLGSGGPSTLRTTGALLSIFTCTALVTWLAGAQQREAAVLFGLAATALGAGSVGRPVGGRASALTRIVFVGLALLFLEAGVRYTKVADLWVASPEALASQAAQDALASFDALEAGTHPQVPKTGFPVVAPPKGTPPRLVVLGGSEVAGGPGSDALADYFPAHLSRLASPDLEVLNQGVGDWTTFHIRHFAETHLAELTPDVVIVYAGQNDLVEGLPLTLSELHQHWQVHGTDDAPSLLADLRLLQGSRSLLTAVLDPKLRPAVPVGDAAENLATVATVTRNAGGRLLLVSQGLAANTTPLSAYNAMLADLAEAQDDVELLDAASLFQAAGPGQFIDERHLTTTGSALLAEALLEHLTGLGWVAAPAADVPE